MHATAYTSDCGIEFSSAEATRSHELLCDQCAGATEPQACILPAGADADDCTTHEHEGRRCNWCGVTISQESADVWLDAMDDAGCEKNGDDGHQPEPTVRGFWQAVGSGDTQTLDSTTTPEGSPVSLTLRAVLAPWLVNSSGKTITWEYAVYRTYHAAGTNVPELGPWTEVDRQQGWSTEDKAKEWAEHKLDMVAEDWDPESDDEYAAKVEQVTAVQQAQAARDDRVVVDKIAALLGTSPDWNADHLTRIADLIGTVRPHPGGHEDPSEYGPLFLAARGHQPPEVTVY